MIAFILTQPKSKTSLDPHLKNAEEQKLINGLRNHNMLAFNQLYKMYAHNLLGVIVKIVNQQETAEDLLQDVFLKIKRNIHSYDEDKSRLFTWLLNITRNTAFDHLRKKSSRQQKTNVVLDDAGAEMENYAHSPNIDTIGVRKLVDALHPKHKKMLDLSYYQGYTHEEIAELLEMPLGSVKTCIRQAILKLRNIFEA